MELVEMFLPYFKTVLALTYLAIYGKKGIFKVTKDKVSSYAPP